MRKDLNDEAQLLAVIEAVGLDREAAKQVLTTQEYAKIVEDDKRLAIVSGIRSVPVFIIDEQYVISGVQPVDIFIQTFKKAMHNE